MKKAVERPKFLISFTHFDAAYESLSDCDFKALMLAVRIYAETGNENISSEFKPYFVFFKKEIDRDTDPGDMRDEY